MFSRVARLAPVLLTEASQHGFIVGALSLDAWRNGMPVVKLTSHLQVVMKSVCKFKRMSVGKVGTGVGDTRSV